MSRWIDVSQPLQAGIPVWPGDTPFSYDVAWSKAESGSANVGRLVMSTHAGTHVDVPFHFDDSGARTIEMDVNLFVGRARVFHIPGVPVIDPGCFTSRALVGAERVLIRTDAWQDRTVFPTAIPSIHPDLAAFFADYGIRLLGVDVPSVDPLDSKALPAHHALARHGLGILEGLVLDHIPEGDYDLMAVPLPLVDGDGSPVRALLKPL